VVANLLVLVTAHRVLPFAWPALGERSVPEHLLDANLALLQVLLLMGVVFALTRNRKPTDVAGPFRLASVSKTYRGASPVHALRNVSVTFASGSSRAVMGPSGSGKSTFLHCASGLDLQ
jgi:ABC-type bacteriocin/lantibiotic exporter with double-glycine peptidase domain